MGSVIWSNVVPSIPSCGVSVGLMRGLHPIHIQAVQCAVGPYQECSWFNLFHRALISQQTTYCTL